MAKSSYQNDNLISQGKTSKVGWFKMNHPTFNKCLQFVHTVLKYMVYNMRGWYMKEFFEEIYDLLEIICRSVVWNYRQKHKIKSQLQIEWETWNAEHPQYTIDVEHLCNCKGVQYIK